MPAGTELILTLLVVITVLIGLKTTGWIGVSDEAAIQLIEAYRRGDERRGCYG
jgi:hypothetical protein